MKSDLELLLDAIEKGELNKTNFERLSFIFLAESLFQQIVLDNAEDVEKYANSENIHYVNNKGQTPLHLACGKGNNLELY